MIKATPSSNQIDQAIDQKVSIVHGRVLVVHAPKAAHAGKPCFFLFSTSQVEDILKEITVYPVPFSPSFAKGIAEWRGHVTPVLSLEQCLGLAMTDEQPSRRLLVVRAGKPNVQRAIVKSTSSIHILTLPIPSTPVPFDDWIPNAFLVRGVYEWKEGYLILVNLERILSNDWL